MVKWCRTMTQACVILVHECLGTVMNGTVIKKLTAGTGSSVIHFCLMIRMIAKIILKSCHLAAPLLGRGPCWMKSWCLNGGMVQNGSRMLKALETLRFSWFDLLGINSTRVHAPPSMGIVGWQFRQVRLAWRKRLRGRANSSPQLVSHHRLGWPHRLPRYCTFWHFCFTVFW